MASYAEIDCLYLNHTAQAVLIEVDEDEYWIPLSQLDPNEHQPDFDDLKKYAEITIYVAEWLAIQKGLV